MDGIEIDHMCEAFHRLIEAHTQVNSPFHNPVVSDAQMALRSLRAVLAAAQAKSAAPAEQIGPEWQPCVKLPIPVHVREQRPGESHISTREGIAPVKPDDLIMRGVQGEEYPIGREIFERTYRMGEAKSGPAVVGWQPIETAPRDLIFLLALPISGNLHAVDRRVYEGRWDEGQQTFTSVNGFLLFDAATHWMPLPAAPSPEGEAP